MTWFTENPWPVTIICGILALGLIFAWFQVRHFLIALAALITLLIGLSAQVVDRLVVTDREQLEALFPRLAVAVEKGDVDTIIAAIDPAMRRVVAEARRDIQQYRPKSVTLTDQQTVVHEDRQPRTARVAIIARVVGMPGASGGDAILIGVDVDLRKDGEQWLITDFDADRADPFKKISR